MLTLFKNVWLLIGIVIGIIFLVSVAGIIIASAIETILEILDKVKGE